MAELTLPISEATATSAALPWEWFDFAQSPRPIDAGLIKTVEHGGGEAVWKISAAGLELPFKFLRRASADGAPRPVLMMLHGMGLCVASFRGIAPWLLSSHDLLLPDYSLLTPGTRCGWPRGGVSLATLAGIVWTLADALKIDRLSLAGNSLGGGLSLLAALEKPQRIEKILLSNPACYPQTLPRMYRYARVPLLGELLLLITKPEKLIGGIEYIGYVQKDRFDAELRRRYLQNMATRKNRHRLMDLIRHLPGHERDLAASPHLPQLTDLRIPVLITWGLSDPLLAQGAGKRLAEDLPTARYIEFPQYAHMPHEEAPEVIGPLWREFLTPPTAP